jgi:hypothetical protein
VDVPLKKLFAVVFLLLCCVVPVKAADQGTAAGLWHGGDSTNPDAWIFIVERGGAFEGFVVKSFPDIGDQASDASAIPLIQNMKRDGLTYGGILTDRGTGQTYPARMILSPDGETLLVRTIGSDTVDRSDLPGNPWHRLPDTALEEVRHFPVRLSYEDRKTLEYAKRVTLLREAIKAAEQAAARGELPPVPRGPRSSLHEREDAAKAALAEQKRLLKEIEAEIAAEEQTNNKEATAGPSGSPTNYHADTRTPSVALSSKEDAECRERMKKLGVVNDGPCIDVGGIVRDLAEGDYSFNKPKTAYVGDPFTIRLLLKTSDNQVVQDTFKDLPGEVTPPVRAKIAQSLEATLRGHDFVVDPPGPLARTATTAAPVIWEWKVTPQSGGKKTLWVDVAANIQAGADKNRVQIKTLSESIIIEVSTFYRVKAYLAAANGFLLAAGATIPALITIFGLVPKARSGVATAWMWLRRKPKADRATEAANRTRQ